MKSTFWRVAELKQLECIAVTGSRHCFPRHFHETYVIEVVEAGINEFWCEGQIHSAEPNDIIVIHPGQIHTGYPAGERALTYRAFYPSKNLIASAHHQLYGDDSVPRFQSPVIRDRRLAKMFRKAHILMEQTEMKIVGHSLFVQALGELLTRHSVKHGGLCTDEASSFLFNRVQPALDFLTERYSENISLTELSTFCGLSEYHFLRTFKRRTGLAPYQYVIATRVEESRKLLSEGLSIAEAAARTGFCDQSHLNRHFKRILGITPGKYNRNTTRLVSKQL